MPVTIEEKMGEEEAEEKDEVRECRKCGTTTILTPRLAATGVKMKDLACAGCKPKMERTVFQCPNEGFRGSVMHEKGESPKPPKCPGCNKAMKEAPKPDAKKRGAK